jgi:hypothetical protein
MNPYVGMRAVREQMDYCAKLGTDLVQKSSAFLRSTVEVSLFSTTCLVSPIYISTKVSSTHNDSCC